MQRVSVVGSSGSGKSTLARRVAQTLDLPYVELDALHWGPTWTEATADELRARVADVTATDAWVIDGNYQSKIGELVWERADTVVWVNPPRWRAMSQVLARTVRRIRTQEELWSGNRESWRGLMVWRREDSVIWWAWHSYGPTRDRYLAAMASGPSAALTWYRLRSRREADALVAALVR